ncbi:low-complexity tail membrane protein [Thermoleptolyngbya sp.]
MRSFWSDPYLWVHLAGLAAVPLLAEVCWVGLAVGDPWLPVWLEMLLVGAAGIAPVLWMQWQRPFCIFSLTPLALRPDALSDDRRRMLHLFRGTEVRALAGSAAIALFILLWQLFRFAPVATEAAAILPQNRALGLLIVAVAFLLCNLFVQVPLSVIRVLLSSDGAIAQYAPYTPAEVAKSFTIPGFRVKQILPDWVAEPRVSPAIQRDVQSHPYGNRPQPQPIAPLAVDEALDESPWDESEPFGSEPLTPEPVTPELATPEPGTSELSTPELATPELATPESPVPEPIPPETITPELATPEPPLENATVPPEPLSEASQEASPGASQAVSQLENFQPMNSGLEGAIAQAPEPPAAEATILDAGLDSRLNQEDDLGDSIAAGSDALNALDSPDLTLELVDASATESAHDSSAPQILEIVDASALLANPSAEETSDRAIAPQQDSLTEPSNPSPGTDLSTPAALPNVDVEALVAEALEAVDAELLREMPEPLTDVTLTDDAEAAVDSPERPPAEEL